MSSLINHTTALAQSFTLALLLSVLQGAAVYIAVSLLFRTFRSLSALLRYNISLGGLALVVAWFIDTFISLYNRFRGVAVYISQPEVTPSGGGKGVVVTQASAVADFAARVMPAIGRYTSAVLIAYSVGVAVMLLRLGFDLGRLHQIRKTGLSTPPAHLRGFVDRWCSQLGITGFVGLAMSMRVDVPMVTGFLKPVILLPVAMLTCLSADQVEAVILHELAHVRRRDYLLNIFQVLVETVFFFNPFIWLLSAIARREREHCCDDLVVDMVQNRLGYAHALATLEEERSRYNNMALAATGNKNQLLNRIKRIIEMKNENTAHRSLPVAIVAVLALAVTLAVSSLNTAQAQKKKDNGKTSSRTVSTTKVVTIDDKGKKKVVEKTSTTGTANADDDVDIRISVKDDGNDKAKAKVTVVTTEDDKAGGKKKVRKEVVISAADDKDHFNKEDVERELAKAKKELEAIDWDQVGDEISAAFAEINDELNLDKLAEEITIEVKKGLAESKKAVAEAKKGIADAHAHAVASYHSAVITNTDDIETMLNKMDEDGLIDRSKKFVIEKDGDELIINGQAQPRSVLEKYSRYLKGGQVTVRGSKGKLSININN